MNQIDLDDLPPRLARVLSALTAGQELAVVQGGALVARLKVVEAPEVRELLPDLPPDEAMEEVFEHFKSMIEEEF